MTTLVLSHESYLTHDTGSYHPECPDRLRSVLKALDQSALSGFVREDAPRATIDQISRAHPGAYADQMGAIERSYVAVRLLDVEIEPNREWTLKGDSANALFCYVFTGVSFETYQHTQFIVGVDVRYYLVSGDVLVVLDNDFLADFTSQINDVIVDATAISQWKS